MILTLSFQKTEVFEHNYQTSLLQPPLRLHPQQQEPLQVQQQQQNQQQRQ